MAKQASVWSILHSHTKEKKKKRRMRSLLNGTFGIAIGLNLRIKPMTYAPLSSYTLFLKKKNWNPELKVRFTISVQKKCVYGNMWVTKNTLNLISKVVLNQEPILQRQEE